MTPLLVAALLTAATPPPPPPPPTEPIPLSDASLVQEDLDPTVKLLDTDLLEMRIGGLLQVHTALYVGDDALLANGDVASRPGFLVRRARIGLEGRLGKRMGVLLAVNLLESDPEVGTIADAKLTYGFAPWLGLSLGTGKVPFSRGALQSSRGLLSIERPLSVGQITPSRRLGLTAEGAVWKGKLGYVVAVMNGTEGFSEGNQFGGVLYGARVEVTTCGVPTPGLPGAYGFSAGVSALRDNAPGTHVDAFGADAVVAFEGVTLQLEALYDKATPSLAPTAPVALPTTRERFGAYAELGYALFVRGLPLTVSARAEWFDDNTRLEDAGDALLFSGGVNLELMKDHARAQLHYLMRRERHGAQRDNDVLVLAVQGSF